MSVVLQDLTGKQFGKWHVVSKNVRSQHGWDWHCKCVCGTEKIVLGNRLRSGRSQSCGCERTKKLKEVNSSRSGNKHHMWKGGRHVTKTGYVILNRPEHPNSNRGRVAEHVVVMTKILGRPLYKGETVHHKNGIRSDNRPENLELHASAHGRGQRIPDLVEWAREILARYT